MPTGLRNHKTCPPSARIGLSHQAGLLTWLHPPAAAFPDISSGIRGDVHLTALGTFRHLTGFPILLHEAGT